MRGVFAQQSGCLECAPNAVDGEVLPGVPTITRHVNDRDRSELLSRGQAISGISAISVRVKVKVSRGSGTTS